jgi:ABC-type sulfate transport system permease subunit
LTGPRGWGEAAALAFLVVLVGLLCVWPIVRLGVEAVAPGGELDLAVAREVLGARSTWRATWNSLDAALCSSALALVFGTAFAFLVGATDARGQTPKINKRNWEQRYCLIILNLFHFNFSQGPTKKLQLFRNFYSI